MLRNRAWRQFFASGRSVLLILVVGCILAFSAIAESRAQNLADHVGGYVLGDFENKSTVDLGFGPGKSSLGGDLYVGPASSVVGITGSNEISGLWSDFGDIAPNYYSGNANLLYYQQSAAGTTHGSKAIQFYNILGPGTFNGLLGYESAGADMKTAAALIHASALKVDVTFDRSLLQNPINGTSGGNPYQSFEMAINTPVGFQQAKFSYDSLSALDPATLASTHRVTTQPNYEASTLRYDDTANWPGTAPGATSYGDSPVVTGTGSLTMTLTIDFTKNLQNGAPGNTDGGDPPTWLLKHNSIVSKYNSVDPDPNNTGGLTYGQRGTFYNIYLLDFSLGTMNQGGVEVDNIRLILPGDFNQDGSVNAADIPAAEAALANLSGYMATYKMNSEDMNLIGDLNGDNKVTNADLQALLNYIKNGNGSSGAVPEPTTIGLLAMGGVLLVARRRFRRA